MKTAEQHKKQHCSGCSIELTGTEVIDGHPGQCCVCYENKQKQIANPSSLLENDRAIHRDFLIR